MRGATEVSEIHISYSRISIHAPHAGRDGKTDEEIVAIREISIHAPHAGRDSARI